MNFLLASATEHAENGFIIPGDTNEVIWGTISFTLIVVLFLWKGLGPVKVMWNGRIDRIRNEVTSAADTRAAAEAKLAEVESNIANAADERQRIIAGARTDAQTVKAQIITRAGTDAADLKARGLADAQSAKLQATSDLQAEIGVLALGAAEKVVANSLDAATQNELIDSYINSVGASS
jgi:F-type H+-transporting ATPase subunit b